jgi:hypothetical protein
MKAVIPLDQEASNQAIEAAARTQAQIVLESLAFPSVTINGFLISGDDKALLMEITGHPMPSLEGVINAPCTARLYGERRYEFPTMITDVPRWGRSALVAFVRPRLIGLVERRRFIRARLSPSSQVQLAWRHSGVAHSHSAPLLNISPGGLACRLDGAIAATIGKNDLLDLTFEIGGQGECFSFQAAVKNKTPASEGFTILGLQFVPAPEAVEKLVALRELLETPAKKVPTLETCV